MLRQQAQGTRKLGARSQSDGGGKLYFGASRAKYCVARARRELDATTLRATDIGTIIDAGIGLVHTSQNEQIGDNRDVRADSQLPSHDK